MEFQTEFFVSHFDEKKASITIGSFKVNRGGRARKKTILPYVHGDFMSRFASYATAI